MGSGALVVVVVRVVALLAWGIALLPIFGSGRGTAFIHGEEAGGETGDDAQAVEKELLLSSEVTDDAVERVGEGSPDELALESSIYTWRLELERRESRTGSQATDEQTLANLSASDPRRFRVDHPTLRRVDHGEMGAALPRVEGPRETLTPFT